MNELLTLSALQLAEKISKKETSPSEVLEAHIVRIEQVNPQLNALVENDFIRARKQAFEQTEQLAKNNSNLPPFFGVPFTVKEMFAYAGMKRTGGSVYHQHDVMDWDATLVHRMKAAGAIPMGTTNVPELGFWFETYNKIYGVTNNPYDVKRTAGGSSGGEGALIGAGASPMGLGSDVGGSIRMPASFCGVFGHKPSRHLLPFTGHFPYSQEDLKNILVGDKYPYTTNGPLCRKACDLYTLMQVLIGPDGFDQHTLSGFKLNSRPLVQDWSKIKIILCADPVFHGTRATDPELVQSVKNCGKLFEQLGAEIYELDPRFFVRSVELWIAALKNSKTKNLYESLSGPEEKFSPARELFRITVGKSPYILPNILTSMMEIFKDPDQDLSEELQALKKMTATLTAILGENGILILPPHSRVAPKHGAPLLTPFDFIYTGIFTMLGLPATSIPMGLNQEQLPLGVQVVAGPLNDHLTLACAEFLEEVFGGWVPPHI